MSTTMTTATAAAADDDTDVDVTSKTTTSVVDVAYDESGNEKLWEIQMMLCPLDVHEDVPTATTTTAAAAAAAAAAGGGGGGGSTVAPKKFKWSTALDNSYKFDFINATPLHDIRSLVWDDGSIKGIERSDSGSEGVFFVQSDRGAIVVKGSKTLGNEMMCSLLAMKLGIHIPRSRILRTHSIEGMAMLATMKSLDPSWRSVTNLFDQTYVLIKEYVRGENLNQLTYERASKLFGSCNELHKNGHDLLRQLGALLALDILTNNSDRFPLLWLNAGNGGNVMLDGRHGVSKLIAIDSQLCTLNPERLPTEVDAYISRVDEFFTTLIADVDCGRENTDIRRVRDKLCEWIEYDIGCAGSEDIQRGILDVVSNSSKCIDLRVEMNGWLNVLLAYEPSLVGLKKVNVPFLMRVWEVFQRHSDRIVNA